MNNMAFDFDKINSGERFTKDTVVSANDLEQIVEEVLSQRNTAVTVNSNYNSFVVASKGLITNPQIGYNYLDNPLSRNAEYYIGVVENLTLNFRTDFANGDTEATEGQPKIGDTIFIQFVSGENATNLTINGATLNNFVPLANHICEIEAVCVIYDYSSEYNYGSVWNLSARQTPAVIE